MEDALQSCSINGLLTMDTYSGQYFDLEDCDDAVIYAKYIEDDVTSHEEFVTVFEFKDSDAANKAFNSYLTEEIIDTSSLNSDEYSESSSKSYFVFNMDAEDYYDIIVAELKESGMTDEQIEAYKDIIMEEMEDYAIVVAFYQLDNKLIQFSYMSTGGASDCVVSSYIEDIGFSSPFDVENSDSLLEQFLNAIGGY